VRVCRHNFAPGEYIAIVNSGGIRAGIAKGPVTLDTVKSILPFGNELRFVVANGSTIKAMLEHSVEANEAQGRFLITSGLRFWWNPAAKPLSRVARVEVRGAAPTHGWSLCGVVVAQIARLCTLGRW
jgi:2',3'-cyclic-nucleotide 2'-phosphodiesterase (5'-nucleotidase family)